MAAAVLPEEPPDTPPPRPAPVPETLDTAGPREPPAPDAPAKGGASNRPVIAGVLLLFLFGIAAFQGTFQLVVTPDPEDSALRLETVRWTLSGTVQDAAGRPIANASVVPQDGSIAAGTNTSADGSFLLEGLPSGYNAVNFSHEQHANVTLRLVMLKDETATVTLPAATAQAQTIDHGTVADQQRIGRVLGAIVLILGLLSLIGAVACYQRRRRPLAIAGAIAGFFGALPLSIVIAPATLFLILRNRKDWA